MRSNVTALVAALASVLLVAACGKSDDNKGGGGGSKADKAKATEARIMLKSLAEGARSYYLQSQGRGMTPVPKQFPKPSVGPTPALGACCKSGNKKCAPNQAQWNHPVWTALKFAINKPHRYSYSYIAGKDGKSFTVRANGDLDCDGKYSTYEVSGSINPASKEPATSAAIRMTNPYE